MAQLDFLDPLERITFQAAVKRRAPQVLVGKFAFTFNYDKLDGHVWFEPAGSDFNPCGYLLLERVVHPSWVGEE